MLLVQRIVMGFESILEKERGSERKIERMRENTENWLISTELEPVLSHNENLV